MRLIKPSFEIWDQVLRTASCVFVKRKQDGLTAKTPPNHPCKNSGVAFCISNYNSSEITKQIELHVVSSSVY